MLHCCNCILCIVLAGRSIKKRSRSVKNVIDWSKLDKNVELYLAQKELFFTQHSMRVPVYYFHVSMNNSRNFTREYAISRETKSFFHMSFAHNIYLMTTIYLSCQSNPLHIKHNSSIKALCIINKNNCCA